LTSGSIPLAADGLGFPSRRSSRPLRGLLLLLRAEVGRELGPRVRLDGPSRKPFVELSGDVVTYKVGGAGRTTQVTDSANNFVMSATYAPPGLLAGMTSGTGIATSNYYNNRLQPFMLSAGPSSGAVFSQCYDFHLHVGISNSTCSFLAYATGNNGNVFQITNNLDTTRSAVYAYDSLNRISQANTVNTSSTNCWGETYTIDTWGNLTNISAASGMAGNCTAESVSATSTTLNQLNGVGLMYDAAGNVTQDNLGNAYTYDSENRIATVAGYTYSYDADGARMEKSTGSTGTMYWQGPSGALAETNLAGTINEEYIFFNGARIARVDRPSGTPHYYFSNNIGSHTVVTNATGVCEQDIDYYPYGGVIKDYCPVVAQHYKFTGKERDTESGLDNFEARYDASSLGRFMTPDPMGGHLENPQSLNKYAYVLNNPTSLTDPTGLDSYLSCTQTKDNASTCQSQTVGYDANGKAQTATVQGVTNADKSFTATQIGNDANGKLVDKTTGTGSYTASANGSGVQFSNNGGQTSSSGVFVNGTPQNTFQDAGFANGGALSGFTFTLTNSKLEAGQTEAGSFTFAGTPDQAGAALQKAGFNPRSGENVGMNEYRSPGSFWTGANSSHFNVFQIGLKPWLSVPQAQGDMHFGEHNPYSPFGWVPHSSEANQ
jgi:RHS repeat-associated protein